MKLPALVLYLVVAGLLMGCVSTPQTRIDKNPDLFASFSAEQKALILKGEIELGFTKEMVLMAAGMPDRKTKKKTEAGVGEVWTYFSFYPRPVISGFGYYGNHFSYYPYGGHYGRGSYYPFPTFYYRGKREKNLVVDFRNGEVVAFEMQI